MGWGGAGGATAGEGCPTRGGDAADAGGAGQGARGASPGGTRDGCHRARRAATAQARAVGTSASES